MINPLLEGSDSKSRGSNQKAIVISQTHEQDREQSISKENGKWRMSLGINRGGKLIVISGIWGEEGISRSDSKVCTAVRKREIRAGTWGWVVLLDGSTSLGGGVGVHGQAFLSARHSARPSIFMEYCMREISKPENLTLKRGSILNGRKFSILWHFDSVFPLAPRNLRGIENCITCSKNQNKDRKQWLLVTFSGSGPEDVYRKDSFLTFDL